MNPMNEKEQINSPTEASMQKLLRDKIHPIQHKDYVFTQNDLTSVTSDFRIKNP